MRITVISLMLLAAGCSAPQVIMEMPKPVTPVLSGIDSIRIQTAWKLADKSFATDAEEASRLVEKGQTLADLADSLLEFPPISQVRDTISALEAFNAGSDSLGRISGADSVRALELLENAAEKFEEALEADAFDDEARQWLAHVYKILAQRFQQSGAAQDRLRVLQRLVKWNQDRHDFIALLAAAQEDFQTEASGMIAGALWERAALVALDDVSMGISSSPDSASLFAYHVRASRAFILANRSTLARKSLYRAQSWQRTEAEHALIHADSLWLAWDGGNVVARKRFDVLLRNASINPAEMIEGMLILLEEIQSQEARTDVQHQLALARYASGSEEKAIELMMNLVKENPNQKALTEDYAIMSYNLAQQQRKAGNLRRALAYLLQCASLDASIAARSAFDAALLLKNNLNEAIRYAHMAEDRMDTLDESERSALIRYLAELYRRNGDRERAREYIMHLQSNRGN